MNSAWYRNGDVWLPVAVLLAGLAVYTATLNPTIDFWDCGEFVAVSHIVGVPHQPGTPLYVIMGRVFIVLFGQPDTSVPSYTSAWAVNFMSALFSALAAMFVYLIIVRVARRNDPDSGWLARIGGLVGALFYVFSDTAWINAVEAEVYGLAAFMMALLTWLALVWYDHRRESRSDWVLLLLIYLCGLGVGFHLGSLLVYPALFVLVWLARDRHLPILDLLLVSAGLALFLASTTFIRDSGVLTVLLVLLVAGCALRMVWPRLAGADDIKARGGKPRLVPFALIGLLLFGLGLSVHAVLMMRAGAVPEPAINQTVPSDFETLMTVLRREQYPPINPLERKAPLTFQFGYYYEFLMRQFSFLPHAGPPLDKASVLLGPLLLALLGVSHVLRRARPLAWLLVMGYLINADGLTLYLNFTANEVRERDYFYFAAFLYAAMFIGLGTTALLRWTGGPLGPSREDLERGIRPASRGGPFVPAAFFYQLVAAFAVALVVMVATPAAAKERWLGLFLFGGVFAGLALAPWIARLASPAPGRPEPRAWSDRALLWRLFYCLGIGVVFLAFFGLLMQFAPTQDHVFAVGLYLALVAGQVLHLGERRGDGQEIPALPARPAVPAARVDKLSWVAGAVLVILAVLPAIGAFDPGAHRKWFTHDRSCNYIAHEYAYNILAGLDRDAILFTNGDNDTFPVWYLQEVEHFRRDVTVVNLSLINLSWYIKQLTRMLQPIALSYSHDEIDQLQPRVFRDRDTGELVVIYVRDYVVQDIIVTNRASARPRPVFFAVTIPRENMDRYYSMLQMEGLAYRLIDKQSADGMPHTDSERLLANVFSTYRFDSIMTGDSAARKASFASQAGWPPDLAVHDALADLREPLPVDFESLLPLFGRERVDVHRDPNTSNLLGNYPASIARAGFTFLSGAEEYFTIAGEFTAEEDALYDHLIDRALVCYDLARRFDPYNVLLAAGGYPALLLERGKIDSALSYVEEIQGKLPGNIEQEALRSTILSLMTLDLAHLAVSWLESRLDANPSWRLGYEMLFRLHETSGSVDGAAGVLERWRGVHGQDDPTLLHHLEQMRDRAQQQEQTRIDQMIRESGILPEEP